MKIILLISGLIILSSCAEISKLLSSKETVEPAAKKRTAITKKSIVIRKSTSKSDVSGTLASGMLYEATPDEDGFVIYFDPFMPKKDNVFVSAINHIIAKLYSDKLKDESNISIESDIDYTIFKGQKARYKIIPNKESNGEISSISITSI